MEGVAAHAPPARRRNDKGRRTWSAREEEVLLSGLSHIIANGWKADNGFRVGYLQALEAYMCREFPGTDLKVVPHINSKIHDWKKNYGSLFTMLSKSGIGWNNTTKMIEATDEAWESYLKVDINAKLMRFKSWPFYEQWCEIFGRDRATGLGAEGFAEAVNKVLQTPDLNGSNRGVQGDDLNESNMFDGLDMLFAEEVVKVGSELCVHLSHGHTDCTIVVPPYTDVSVHRLGDQGIDEEPIDFFSPPSGVKDSLLIQRDRRSHLLIELMYCCELCYLQRNEATIK